MSEFNLHATAAPPRVFLSDIRAQFNGGPRRGSLEDLAAARAAASASGRPGGGIMMPVALQLEFKV
jgi:hypothetical protein